MKNKIFSLCTWSQRFSLAYDVKAGDFSKKIHVVCKKNKNKTFFCSKLGCLFLLWLLANHDEIGNVDSQSPQF